MSLTNGPTAPLGRPTGGFTNFPIPNPPAHLLFAHPVERRVRGEVGAETVVDTADLSGVLMLHETRLLPRWYFPREAVRTDLLEPSDTVTHCPFKGDATYFHLRVGDRLVEDAFWTYEAPNAETPWLAGLLSPYVEKLDRWREEDEIVIIAGRGHPRDPFHRIDTRISSRRVVVRAGDVVVADSQRPIALYETGLPVRWYLPVADVVAPLVPSTTTSICSYKGEASYWSVAGVADAGWTYRAPFGEAQAVAGYVSFLAEGIDVTVDE